MNKTIPYFLGAALYAATFTSHAEVEASVLSLPPAYDTVNNRGTGFYLGFSAGRSSFIDFIEHHLYTSSEAWTGYSPFAGYQFNSYFALEWGYIRYANLNFVRNVQTRDGANITLDTLEENQAAYGAAKLTLPVGDNWQLYGKLGGALSLVSITYSWNDGQKESDTAQLYSGSPYVAFGLSYYLAHNLAMSLESAVTAYISDTNNALFRRNLSLGLTYRF